MESVIMVKRCSMCAEKVLYNGPDALRDAVVWCSTTCERLWDAVTPGEWIDAAELMRGGRLYDRPDIWTET